MRDRLEAKTYLHRGLHVIFEDEATREKIEFTHDGGIADYLVKIAAERGKPPIHPNVFAMAKDEPRVEVALQWTESTDEHVRSYVNGIPTRRAARTRPASSRAWSRRCATSSRPTA